MLKNFKELKVWQKSYGICMDVYKITRAFPSEEKYGMVPQIRRAAASIPSHIADGYGRRSTDEYIKMLHAAYGSLCELETHLMLSGDLCYFKDNRHEIIIEQMKETERMLKALIKVLSEKKTDPQSASRDAAGKGPGR